MDKWIAIIQKLGKKIINEDQGLHDLLFKGPCIISDDDVNNFILTFKILQTKTSLLIIF